MSACFFPEARMSEVPAQRGNPSVKCCRSPGRVGVFLPGDEGKQQRGLEPLPSEPPAPRDPLAIASVTIRESTAPGLLFP